MIRILFYLLLTVACLMVTNNTSLGQTNESGDSPTTESAPAEPNLGDDQQERSDGGGDQLTDNQQDSNAPKAARDGQLDSKTLTLLSGLTVFVLSIFVGFEVITKVPPTLHTPLMSGSNAISGITIVGAVIIAGYGTEKFVTSSFGLVAVALATINVVGGFLVTHRMLAMFKKR